MSGSYNICLDVGGTKVLGAIFNEKDEIIYRLKKRSKSGGEGTSSQEALYRYFSTRKVQPWSEKTARGRKAEPARPEVSPPARRSFWEKLGWKPFFKK